MIRQLNPNNNVIVDINQHVLKGAIAIPLHEQHVGEMIRASRIVFDQTSPFFAPGELTFVDEDIWPSSKDDELMAQLFESFNLPAYIPLNIYTFSYGIEDCSKIRLVWLLVALFGWSLRIDTAGELKNSLCLDHDSILSVQVASESGNVGEFFDAFERLRNTNI